MNCILLLLFLFFSLISWTEQKKIMWNTTFVQKKKRLSKDDRNPSEVTNHTSLYECEFHYDVGSQQPELGLLSSRSQNDGRKLDETV